MAKKLSAGASVTEFSISAYNDMLDMARWWKTEYRRTGADPRRAFKQSGIVRVKNTSGSDIPWLGIGGIDAPLYEESDDESEFKTRPTLKVVEPDEDTHLGKFVVAIEPIAVNAIGWAVISGLAPVLIDVSNASHGFADVYDGYSTGLKSGHHGAAQILWKESGTGAKWALVRLGLPELVRRFELKDALLPGASADAYLLDYISGIYTINTNTVFTVWDISPGVRRGWARDLGVPIQGAWGYVRYFYDSGLWEIFEMEYAAEVIEFTAVEDMGDTTTGQMEVTIDDYYRGLDPQDRVFATPIVHDPQDLFPWALNGAKGKATLDQVDNQYKIVECHQIAERITVTLTEDMGETSAGEATCTVDDYYRGQDPTLYFDGTPAMNVKDPQSLFPRALSGAKGKATFDNGSSGEYHLVESQQMATVIKCTAGAEYYPADATIASISDVDVMLPITGQSPVTGDADYDPVVLGIENTFSQSIDSGDVLIAFWNETDDQWELLKPDDDGIVWAKAQSDWEENSNDPRVSVKLSDDRFGTTVTGAAFWVYLPRTRTESVGLDPSVYSGDVIAIEKAHGSPVFTEPRIHLCVTPYLSSKIGDLRMIKATAKIPTGWRQCDGTGGAWDFKHRVPMGLDTGGESNEDAPGDTGGFRWHGVDGPDEADNNHPDHPAHEHPALYTQIVTYDAGGVTVWDGNSNSDLDQRADNGTDVDLRNHLGPFNSNKDTDNRMPFKVVVMIERYK